MFTTRIALALLRSANPSTPFTEDRIRDAVRRALIEPPDTFGGRWVWRWSDIQALAGALGITPPTCADIEARRARTTAMAGAAR